MLQAEFLTFTNFVMGEISNMNEKISGIFLNTGKQKETKELEHLKTENENKTLIIKSLLENLSQLASFLQKNHDKQNDTKVTKTILPEEPIFIEPKKTFKRSCNCQNSSYNEPLKSFNDFEVLHHNETMVNNTNYSKEENTTQSKIHSININFKETRRPQVGVNEFSGQHTFQRQKIVPGERPYSEATNPRVHNSSNSIASFIRNIRSNFNNQLKESRARFKYFPGASSTDLLLYIEPTLGEGQFDTAIIHVGINDLLHNTTGTEVLLRNILKIAARCKMHGIKKIFVSCVLNTHKVPSDIIAKLNLDISNTCRGNRFHFIDNSNISMNFLYTDGLHLLYSGKELLAKKIILT